MIKWKTETVEIEKLKPAKYNPRKISKSQKTLLKESIEEWGECEPLVANTDYTIIGGHQRYKILKENGVKKVRVSIPNRELSQEETKELNLRLNKNRGDFDIEKLKNLDISTEELLSWGFNAGLLGETTIKSFEETEKIIKKGYITLTLAFGEGKKEQIKTKLQERAKDYNGDLGETIYQIIVNEV